MQLSKKPSHATVPLKRPFSFEPGTFRRGCLEGTVNLREGGGESGSLLLGTYAGGVYAGGPTWLVLPYLEGVLYVDGTARKELSRAVFTGDEVVFVYPDYKTALVGR
jgi:hypothetical protein